MSRKCDLYRCFDEKGCLLYVGASYHAILRFAQHISSSCWSEDVATITIEKFDSRKAAFDAERAAIQSEGPKYNRHMRIEFVSEKRCAVGCNCGRHSPVKFIDRDSYLQQVAERDRDIVLGLSKVYDPRFGRTKREKQ